MRLILIQVNNTIVPQIKIGLVKLVASLIKLVLTRVNLIFGTDSVNTKLDTWDHSNIIVLVQRLYYAKFNPKESELLYAACDT